jgi:hypothetical protein
METRRKILSFLPVMAFLSLWGNGWGVEGVKPPVGNLMPKGNCWPSSEKGFRKPGFRKFFVKPRPR